VAKYPKRLIEVDLPIRRISEQARREKSIRHGHISTLHIWWARRPLAACRAVLCAALWPDPTDPECPSQFRNDAKNWMKKWANEHLNLIGPESSKTFVTIRNKPDSLDCDLTLRTALLDFIADFSDWDNAGRREYLETSRALTLSAHGALNGEERMKPLVVDPFAGGGAIPLEALRVGADCFASDLNPVAVLLNKVVLEYVPLYGQRLIDELQRWGNWVKQRAEEELSAFYPRDPDGSVPIAYLWSRTIKCEGPGCGAEVPLIRSMWLARTGDKAVSLALVPNLVEKRVEFQIVYNAKPSSAVGGTVRRGSATCPCCGFTTPVEAVRRQLKTRLGGAIDARLIAVVTYIPGVQGRRYRLATENDYQFARQAAKELEQRRSKSTGPISIVPDESYPDETAAGALSSSVLYGPKVWGDIFTPRQLLALTSLVKWVREAAERMSRESDVGLAKAIQTCLGLVVDRLANTLTSLSRWDTSRENVQGVFSRQALPMVWDFTEANSFSGATGDFDGALEWVLKVCSTTASLDLTPGQVEKASATNHLLPDESAHCIFTDPPYYDAIAYGDLSDFFYVWLKRTVGHLYPDLFRTQLVDKSDEIVHLSKRFRGPYSHKTKEYFEKGMTQALAEAKRVLTPDGIGVVVFAHKSTSGWEAQLQAMVDAGWTITGSWPIDTEMGSRMNAMGTASLASSVHLVCRPRARASGETLGATIGEWRDVLNELPKRIHDWMPRLAAEGVVGADAIFACLGPALEVFSRYDRVEKSSGELVTLREYLEHVWAAVAREALLFMFKDADATGLEEDARLTAMWLWTIGAGANGNGATHIGDEDAEENSDTKKTTSATGFSLEYDAARLISQGLGVHLEKLGHVVEIKGETARLLSITERAKYLLGVSHTKPIPIRRAGGLIQGSLFEDMDDEDSSVSTNELVDVPKPGTTVLDRVHQAMLAFGAGQAEALRRFLVDEGVGKSASFWSLAQSLSALYPSGSSEKRWVDGVLARKKSLGF
jgi:putative DNA methylase